MRGLDPGLDPRIHLLREKGLTKIGWIAGSSPRLSGTICASCCHLLHCGPSTTCTTPLSRSRSERAKLEGDLWRWRWWCWRCLEKRGEWSSMHQVCSDEPCEGERALDDPVAVMGQA